MRSLRSRLIAGSILIAVIPLVIVTAVLSRRIESLVRSQASARLTAALSGLAARLEADGRRMDQQLDLLARDATLKRLYLLQPAGSRDLSEALADRRVLLGLDFLQIADARGVVIAEAAAGDSAFRIERRDSSRTGAAGDREPHALGLLREGGAPDFAIVAAAPIPYEGETVGSVHGGMRLDAAFLLGLRGASGVDFVIRDRTGEVRAATLGDPGNAPHADGVVERIHGASGDRWTRRIVIGSPALEAGFAGMISTADADRTIAALQLLSALLALAGLALAIGLGIAWSSQVSRPVERLAAFSQRVAQGEWDEPLAMRSVREIETLVEALDHMRSDLRSYRTRLVTSERQAAWSRMAQTVAHEVKNPLTPIAVSIADLKRSFDQGRPDFAAILEQAVRTVGEEVERLKRMLQEFSDFARLPAPRFSRCEVSRLFDDLEALHRGEIAAGRLGFVRPAGETAFEADPDQIRRALLNLVKNGLEAIPQGGRVEVSAVADGQTLEITVSDDGAGLPAEQRAHLFEPGFTTKREGSGLGLTIVERIVNDHGGVITVEDAAPHGSRFRMRLPRERRP